MVEIKRKLQKSLEQDANTFRIVTILGPRQAGKTTLAKMTFKNHKYVSLEEPEMRELATSDPKTFLRRFNPPAILDEVQRVPDLLSYIQGLVDENPDEKGQFILTGSHQPLLREKIAQSLAGRTSILTLYPLSFGEVLSHDKSFKDMFMLCYASFGYYTLKVILKVNIELVRNKTIQC